jgi:alpha-L-fucosidase
MRMPNSCRSEGGGGTRSRACDLRRPVVASACVALALVAATRTAAQSKRATRHYEATWESLRGHDVPQWYLGAKFGIFVHWGAYSVSAFANGPDKVFLDDGLARCEELVDTYQPHLVGFDRWIGLVCGTGGSQ